MSTPTSTVPSPPKGQDLASVPLRFEATPIPVTDFDRAKAFYQRLGWRLDIDVQVNEQLRAVHFTPPGSPASIQFWPASAAPLQRLLLVVTDIEVARAELVSRGIDVGEIWHATPGQAPRPGRDPDGRSYVTQAAFSDPDGNKWVLQEITERIRGRVDNEATSFTSSLDLERALIRAATAHGEHEARNGGQRDEQWPTWYAAYMVAEQSGAEPPR
jgi:catechol 2,3-dioxygenase-like lactoylglutathione lyase family enzyme